MMPRLRPRAFGLASMLLLTLVTLPLAAQDSGRPAKPAAKAPASARRVPRYYGQIGLTPDQKERIYAIQAQHMGKIEELERQIAEAKEQMNAEVEGVLTPTQKQLLAQRRSSARGGAKAGD